MKPLSKKSLVSKAAKTQDFRSNPVFPEDTRWMRAAIMAAKRGIGRSGVNPPVGCVLIGAGGQLLASGIQGQAAFLMPNLQRWQILMMLVVSPFKVAPPMSRLNLAPIMGKPHHAPMR